MSFFEISKNDFDDWVSMGLALWPNHTQEEIEKEFSDLMLSDNNATFICKDNEYCVAFINLSLHNEYVHGAKSYPVAYVEGIYVKPEYRKKGIAQELIRIAEKWGLKKGCIELASDAELDNIDSQEFHKKLGFNEVNKFISYIKSINTN
jgi:aminoglycoside 6'-N-acetyltransferase I